MLKKITKLNLKDLLYNRKFTVTLSVVLAVIIWFVVIINRNPTRERTFSNLTATVTLDNAYILDNYGIVSDVTKTKFTVTVSGPNYVVSSLKAEDFTLIASPSSMSEGTQLLNVSPEKNGTNTDYEFVSISPSTIAVDFDKFNTKKYTVIPKLDGVQAPDNLIAETPVMAQNAEIEVRGPSKFMERLDSVVAYYKVDKTLTKTESFDAKLKFYDAEGKEVSNNYVTVLGDGKLTVTQPISKLATLKVKPEFKNLPQGIKASDIKYTLNISSVQVIGTPDIVSNMSQLSLMPIDFNTVSGAGSSVTVKVEPNLPDGVRIYDNIDGFEVKINTSGYSEKTFTVSAVKTVGLQSGLTAGNFGKVANVKICGPTKVIRALKAADLYAEIDLTGKAAGQYSILPTIKSSKYNNIWVYGSTGEITVTVK